MLVLILFTWVGMWWLAFRAVVGGRPGPMDWLPVAILAFSVPFMFAELNARYDWGLPGGPFLVLWGAFALGIDGVWAVRKLRRRISAGTGSGG